ncbi:beta-ketoadipyl CoA thiolase, partial [Streptomyces rimosus subsp. rimosus]
ALGEGAELIADKYGIDRAAQDAFALASHRKAARAWEAGAYEAEVVPVPGVDLARDESIRATTTAEALGRLRPAF